MAKSSPSVQKRIREQKKRLKKQEKERRKAQREQTKQDRLDAIARGENPDVIEEVPEYGLDGEQIGEDEEEDEATDGPATA